MSITLDPTTDKWRADNKLRRLSVATPTSAATERVTHFYVQLQAIAHDFHPKIRHIPMWSFGANSPGVILEMPVGKPARITWFNNLVGQNLNMLLDLGTRQGMEEPHMLANSHNQVHLHGARVPWTSDGFPDHVFHPNEGRMYYYPNTQAAAMLWYHDHTMDVTRLNVYAGLFGAYLLRDPKEATLLPTALHEMVLVLQDKSFSADGKKLHYEQSVDRTGALPVATPEFIGQYPVVNGQIWPLWEAHPHIYRLRLLNGANTRFFNLSITPEFDAKQKIPFHVIGTDGGFLSAPAEVSELLLAPGERADVLLDLRGHNHASLILRNDAAIPYSDDPADTLHPDDANAELLKITVHGHLETSDAKFDPKTIKLPPRIDPLPGEPAPSRSAFAAMDAAIDAVPLDVLQADLVAGGVKFKLRRIKLEEYELFMSTLPGVRVPMVQVNGESWMTAPITQPADPLTASATVNTTKDAVEVWEFINVTPDTHPMHLHMVEFQVMSRTMLEVVDDEPRMSDDLPEPKKATLYKTKLPVEPFEQGWKDTVRCNPGQSTRVLAKIDGYTGEYVYHCNILEHQDMGMMSRLNVE